MILIYMMTLFVAGCTAARPLWLTTTANKTNGKLGNNSLSDIAIVGNPSNKPNCGDGCGTTWLSTPAANDDYIWLANDVCNYIANKKGTCCCFADPYGQTKEVSSDHPAWVPLMTRMNAQVPQPVSGHSVGH